MTIPRSLLPQVEHLRLAGYELSPGHTAQIRWTPNLRFRLPKHQMARPQRRQRQGRLHYLCPSSRLSPRKGPLIAPHTVCKEEGSGSEAAHCWLTSPPPPSS